MQRSTFSSHSTGTLTARHQRKPRESSENTFVVINGSSKHWHTYRKYTGSLQSRDTSLLDNLDGTNGVRAFTVISLRVCTLMQQGFFQGWGGGGAFVPPSICWEFYFTCKSIVAVPGRNRTLFRCVFRVHYHIQTCQVFMSLHSTELLLREGLIHT